MSGRSCEIFTPDSDLNFYYNPANPDSVLLPQATEGLRLLIPGIFFILASILIGLFRFLFPN